MAKSKGNVIDPLQLIDAYGTDALRFTICQLAGPGRDVKLGPARVETNRAFVTKLWNAARFCEMNGIKPVPGWTPDRARLPLTRWLLDSLRDAVRDATVALEAYRFDEYAAGLHRFAWNVFCDWFVELSKPILAADDPAEAGEVRAAAAYALGTLLRLLHPAMPFVTEALWDEFRYGPLCTLIRAPWPEPVEVPGADQARVELDWAVRLISDVRSVRSQWRVPPTALVPVLLRGAATETLARAARWEEAIRRLARAASIGPLAGSLPPGAVQIVLGEATAVLPLGDVVDLGAERARLSRDQGKAEAEAAKLRQKLANPGFTGRADPAVVEETRERLAAAEAEAARIADALARLAVEEPAQ